MASLVVRVSGYIYPSQEMYTVSATLIDLEYGKLEIIERNLTLISVKWFRVTTPYSNNRKRRLEYISITLYQLHFHKYSLLAFHKDIVALFQ